MIEKLKKLVDFEEYAYITLETDAVNNEGAIHFYEKNGFIREHFQDGLVIVNMEEARRPEKNCSLNMEKRQEHRYMYTVL